MALHPPDDARAQPLAGMPGPRWNRAKPIYPSHLHTWLDCPHRARLQYIDNIHIDEPWNRKIEVGNALHKVMEEIANVLRMRQPAPNVESYRRRVDALLPLHEYERAPGLTAADRQEDIENVLRWSITARDYITDPTATMVRIEKYYPTTWNDKRLGTMKLGAKADLVMKRWDEQGEYVEIIDYKTGYWQRPLDFAPALTRISHKPQIMALLRPHGYPRVIFTYLWLARDETIRIELTRKHMADQWHELHHILERMLQDEAWPIRPTPKICKHCPYLNTVCFPFETTTNDPPGVDT